MTRTGADARPDLDEQAESFFAWVQDHMREISYAAVALAAVMVIAFLYVKQKQSRERNAESSLAAAEQSIASGNDALAQSDLQKIVTRFAGTPAAHAAVLDLAELLYQKGQYQQGIDALAKIGTSGDSYGAAVVENLIGAGYEEMGKFGDAAAHYRKASEAARFPADRDNYMANAARAYMAANNTAEAVKIWTALSTTPGSAVQSEARVRLGELTAKAAATRKG